MTRLNSDARAANTFRVKVRELMERGLSPSAISKRLGKPYKHTLRIVEQERNASTEQEPQP